ncbi:hypothetical protein PIB30_034912 [Stylosanthes scabra]|uniref:Uncharacterized protein n=1 Tax=Stylosanthes scabra TaxID=79078 RepID=A0ABU6TCQ0_9FABA|nr:hypothetical protein [Stylosanthes scabra]
MPTPCVFSSSICSHALRLLLFVVPVSSPVCHAATARVFSFRRTASLPLFSGSSCHLCLMSSSIHGEVEEQLNLLLELAPTCISEKLASSEDFLFCINKMADAMAIHATLEEQNEQERKNVLGTVVRGSERT